jgi:hypothetical protein
LWDFARRGLTVHQPLRRTGSWRRAAARFRFGLIGGARGCGAQTERGLLAAIGRRTGFRHRRISSSLRSMIDKGA